MTDQLDEAAASRSGKDSPHPSTGDLTAAVSGGAGMRTPASGPPHLSWSISPTSAEAGTLLFPPMKDKTSGSFLSRAETSSIRPVNLVHIMEEQMHEAEDRSIGHEAGDFSAGHNASRKRNKPGPSFSAGPEDTMSVYEKAFLMASQRGSGQIFQPIVGTVFDSEVDDVQYYNAYSWELGFGIKRGTKYVNGTGYKTMQTLLCSCEGGPREGTMGSVRKNCKAMVRMKRTSDHGWYFESVVTEHNHGLADTVGEKRHWQCHNHIDPLLKDVIRHMRGNNIPLSHVYGVLCDLHGGSEALPFRKRSLKSTCIQIAHEASQDDINKLMDMFAKAQLDNGNFFHSVDTDTDRRVRSIFWCHAKARADYIYFGDVITFDTTYKCNLYEMPVGLFIGVNNHFQCCVFGCVILRLETTEAFQWAFRTFLKAMKGKHPTTILTDMCRQMELAIHEEMPNTVHRWCKWYVLKNMRENLGPLYGKDKPFKRYLDFVLNEMMTVDEFEEAWEQTVSEYDLSGCTYMKQVYDCRDKWAKPFFKGKFCAKMTST